MGSNLAFGCRAVFSKLAMGKPLGQNMHAANLFGVLTILGCLFTLPFAVVAEGLSQSTLEAFGSNWKDVLLSGVFHYLNNEVCNLTFIHSLPFLTLTYTHAQSP